MVRVLNEVNIYIEETATNAEGAHDYIVEIPTKPPHLVPVLCDSY